MSGENPPAPQRAEQIFRGESGAAPTPPPAPITPADAAPTPPPTWLERNWLHLGAWIGGALAFGAGYYDLEWGHQLGEAFSATLVVGGLTAFGVSVAYAAGVRTPGPQ